MSFPPLWLTPVQPLDELHAALKQLVIAHILLCPANEHTIQSGAFTAAELLIFQICIVYDLRNRPDFRVPNTKLLAQGFKCAILSLMPKTASLKHVEWDRLRMTSGIAVENELRILVDEAGD